MAENDGIERKSEPLFAPEYVKTEGDRLRADADRINSERDLTKALRDAKPSFLADGRGLRGAPDPQPDRPDINDRKRTDFRQGAVVRSPRQRISQETTQTSSTGSTRQVTPFFVTLGTDTLGPILRVYPGRIAGIVPTLNSIKLDATPRPSMSLVGVTSSFELVLRAKITVDPDNLYRSAVSEVTVRSSTDGLVAPDLVAGVVPELKIIWEDGDAHRVGHFYIKIANLEVTSGAVSGIIQWLFNSYSTFVATGNEVEVLT